MRQQRLFIPLPSRHISLGSKFTNDPYYILGVQKEDSIDDIKKSYFELAKKYHPDLNPDDEKALKRFQEIQEAYRYIQMQKDPKFKAKFQQEFNQY